MRQQTSRHPRFQISSYAVLISLLLLPVVIEALSLLDWAFYPYFPDDGLLFARTDAAIFIVLSPFSPLLLILLLYYWLARLVISLNNPSSRQLKAFLNRLTRPLSRPGPRAASNPQDGLVILDHPRLLLLVAVTAAILLAIVPYRPDLNPTATPVGVDAHFYIEWITQMLQRPPVGALSYAMGIASQGSRPLLLVPMYLAVSTGRITVIQTVESLPAFLGPLLALSVFLFVREGQQNEKMAGLAAILSVFSFNTTVGIWAGFYANWLALVEVFLFLAVLLGFSRSPSNTKLFILTILSLSILLTHPWTWVIVLLVTTVFIGSLWKDTRKTILVRCLVLILIINVLVDFAKNQIFGSLVAAQDASMSLSHSGVSQSLGFWPNIISGLFFAYDGLLANAILLGLSLIAIFYLKFQNQFERLLILWVALSSLPFPFLSSLLQTRILYNLPFSTLTTIGLILAIPQIGNKTLHSNLTLLLVVLLSANYVLKTVTSLVAIPF